MKPITFDHAAIVGVEHKVANAIITSKIKVVAALDARTSEALACRSIVYDRDSIAKPFKSVELDYEARNIRIDFGIERVGSLTLQSESATAFKIIKKGDGRKKPKRLMVQFKIAHAGSPFELIEHLIRIGGAEGRMTIEGVQAQLFSEQQPEKPTDKPADSEPELSNVRLTGPDGEVLFEGTSEEFQQAADSIGDPDDSTGRVPPLASLASMPGAKRRTVSGVFGKVQ